MENLSNFDMFQTLVGIFLPMIIAFFNKQQWSAAIKGWFSFLAVVIVSAFHTAIIGELSFAAFGTTILKIFFLTVTTYFGFWKPTGIAGAVEENIGMVGNKVKMLALLLPAFLFLSCVGTIPYEQSKYCPPPPGADGQPQKSWICEKSEQLNQAPENYYLYIFDAAAIASLWPDGAPDWFCKLNDKIACWYVPLYPNVSPSDVITKILEEANLIKDPRKAAIVKILIRRNFMDFWSVELIPEYDDGLIRGSNNWLRTDFGCGPLICP